MQMIPPQTMFMQYVVLLESGQVKLRGLASVCMA